MTENLRSSPSLLTSPAKKAFSELHPDDFHLQGNYWDESRIKQNIIVVVILLTFYRWRSSILPGSNLSEGTRCQGGGLRIIPSVSFQWQSWWLWFKDHSRPFHNPDESLWKGVWFFAVMAQSVPFRIKGSSHFSGRRPQGSKIFPFLCANTSNSGPFLSLIYNIFIISKDGMVMKLVLEKLTGQEVVTPQPDSKWKRITI